MVGKTCGTRSVVTPATLCDFSIAGAAEVGGCTGAQSFRAVRRRDGQPVLLHKFRPAQSLIDLGPLLGGHPGPPDFTHPFVTRFTDLFAAAGSAYLVEPLPPCFALSDLWRYVLQSRPNQALRVITILIRHLLPLIRGRGRQYPFHGALSTETIVLAPTARFGILAAHLPCQAGRLWLRKDPERPVEPDLRAFTGILDLLLDLEAKTAALQNVPTLLPAAVRQSIRDLLHVIGQATAARKCKV